MIDKYFFEELQYLREAGREFARAFPQQARYLNLDDIADRDPYVERLFEGFAFLTGRVRQKLDDELPELTRSLLELLWPHFVRPVPSLSILEFRLKPGTIQEMRMIARGAKVDSVPASRGVACRFQTSYSVAMRPLTLEQVVFAPSRDGNTTLTFRFAVESGITYQNLGFDTPLRLYLHDLDAPTAYLLHQFLTQHLQAVRVQTSGGVASSVALEGQEHIEAVGYAADEGLLPLDTRSFIGYRLLQEYFVFPEKFLFFDIVGLEAFRPSTELEAFEVQVLFSRPFPEGRRIAASNFRLHCTPIVNIFEREAEPIRLDHRQTEYRVLADVRYPPECVETYSVNAVEGIEAGTGKRQAYVPFYSFRHGLVTDRMQGGRYYHTTARPRVRQDAATGNTSGPGSGPHPGLVTHLSVVRQDVPPEAIPEETLSLQITCTNGALPRGLAVGDICYPTQEVPEYVRFANLTRPTLPIYPPLLDRFEWQLVSHLALNYLSLQDPEALRGILALYDWSRGESTRRRIAAVQDVQIAPKEVVHRGAIIRGVQVTLTVDSSNFSDRGDLHVFGLVLRHFLGMYASLNSFVQLSVQDASGELFAWPWQQGTTSPL